LNFKQKFNIVNDVQYEEQIIMNDSASKAPAVGRAFAILDLLSNSAAPLGISDIVRQLGLAKSTTHGLIHTLLTEGAIRQEGGGYRLDARALAWARGFSLQNDKVASFLRLTASEPELDGETAMLSVLDGDHVLYLATRPGNKPLAVNFKAGGRIPLHCTASGKAMLACTPDSGLASRLESLALTPMTPRSLSSKTALLDNLRHARAQGYAEDDEEAAQGLLCIGAAVLDADGQPQAGVAVSVVKATVDAPRRQALQQAIMRLASKLSAQ